MQIIEVIINSQQMDLDPESTFPLVLAQNVYFSNEVDARGGEFSYTVQFPSTTNNLNILRINTIVEQNGKFYTELELNTVIYVNSIKIFSGVFTITKYNNQLIEGFFKSDNISWASLLTGKKLNEITSFQPYPFNGMLSIYDNMADQYLEQDPSVYNHNKKYDVCFPLLAYGQYFIPYYPKSRSYIDTTRYDLLVGGLRTTTITRFVPGLPSYITDRYTEEVPYVLGELNHLDYQDIPPSYYVTNIIRAMFNDIGYSVTGSWINDPQVNRLIIPTSNVDDVFYNQQTLVDITATVLTDINIFTHTATGITKNTQRNNTYDLIPLTTPAFATDGNIQSMTTFGYIDLFTPIPVNTLAISDNGFNTSNPRIYGDFFCPEDGTYELSYNISGHVLNYKWGPLFPFAGDIYFQDSIIGFFLINDNNETPSIIETHNLTNTAPFGGNPSVTQIEPVPFVSAIPGDGFFSTYDYLGFYVFSYADYVDMRSNPHLFNISKTVNVQLKKGDILRFMCISSEQADPNPQILVGAYNIKINAGSTWGIKNVSGDVDFNVAKNLPAVTCTDFLSSLIKMFNLYFTVDPVSKIISLEKRDNFYLNPQIAVNLDEYCDINISDIVPIELPENYKFSYKPDTKDYLSNLEPDLYSYTVKTVVNNKETQEIQPIFSDTRMKKFQLVKNTANQTTPALAEVAMNNPIFQLLKEIEIPMISDETHNKSLQFDLIDSDGSLIQSYENWDYNNNIRILKISDAPYDLNQCPLVLRYWNTFFNEGQLLQGKEIPRALFVEADNTIYTNYQLDSLDWESLYNKNWYNFILNQQRSNRYVLNIKMTFDLYNKLQSNRLVKINGNYFYIESISGFNVMNQDQVTTINLIKRVN